MLCRSQKSIHLPVPAKKFGGKNVTIVQLWSNFLTNMGIYGVKDFLMEAFNHK